MTSISKFVAGFLLAVVFSLGLTAPGAAQTRIVAVVDGQPITSYAVDQRQKLLRLTGTQGNLRDLALEELIDEAVQSLAYRRAGISVSDEEVNGAIADIAKRVQLSPANLRSVLSRAGVSIDTLEDRMRAQLGFGRLVRARFQRFAQVTEQDLVAALLADESREKAIETAEYDLHEVTIALPENPPARRLAQARSRAGELRGRFASCRDGLPMAKKARNVVVRAIGRRRESDLRPEAVEVLKDVAVGRLSAPIQTARGLSMYAVCDKTVVRSANAAMKALEPDMTAERGEAFSKQYVRQLRRDAVVEFR